MKNRQQKNALVAAALVLASTAYASEFKTAVNPEHLANTLEYGYSQATVVEQSARTIYVAGQIGLSEVGDNGFVAQVDRSFENLAAVLAASNSRAEDVVKITLLVKNIDPQRLAYLVEKRRSFFGANPPVSTLIPVPALALPALEFEIDATAIATGMTEEAP